MPDQPLRQPWYWRFRFRLRSLMIATAVVSGSLGWVIHQAQVQRDVVAAVERVGGEVRYDWQWQWVQGQPVLTIASPWPRPLVELIGVDYFHSVNYVRLQYRGSDELLEQIGKLRRLEYLDLAHSPVTGAGLEHLRGLKSLRWLSLVDTKIGDSSLTHLRDLARLQTLLLGLTDVGDEGLRHLRPLTGLKHLSLHLTQASDQAVDDLLRSMPGTYIYPPGWPGRPLGRALGRALELSERRRRE